MRTFDRRTTSESEATRVAALRAAKQTAAADPDASEAVLAAMERALPSFPLKIQIQTATRCNAACTMCPYPAITTEPGFQHERMSESLYAAILAQLEGRPIERLSLFLMNEPLLDVRLPAWLELARKALPDTTLGLFTNGAALTGSLARRLVGAGLDELCVSVHGFERSTYESVMVGLSFDRVSRNLREVFELHRAGELGALHLQIVCGDVEGLAESLGGADPVYRDHVLLKAFSNEREVVDVARGPSPISARPPSTGELPLCQRPFVKLYVLANGECVLCNVDWRRSVVLGRLGDRPGDDTIESVWNGARYRDLRRRHLLHAFGDDLLCRRCDYAQVVDHE